MLMNTSGMEGLTFDDYGRPIELSKNDTTISDQSVGDDRQNELKFDDYGRHITNHGIDTNIDHQSVHDNSCELKFDDYGRHIAIYDIVSENKQRSSKDGDRMGSGVQKFRVKLHSGIGSRKNIHVLCEIGLAGIRLLDPAKNKPIELIFFKTILRWEATVVAAHYQLMEMGEISKEPSEKRKGLDERNKYVNEQKEHWIKKPPSAKLVAQILECLCDGLVSNGVSHVSLE
ncbi:hypothetical protein Tco_1018209 [Tanacetum coccineum]|uniref:Uncharacterized protein n=1 Tax=Tanacetum coccineum TaxID=301880 RepID=A0ABQ5FU27_9ASTR